MMELRELLAEAASGMYKYTMVEICLLPRSDGIVLVCFRFFDGIMLTFVKLLY